MHVVIDMFGSCESVLIMSTVKGLTASSHDCLEMNPLTESTHSVLEDLSPVLFLVKSINDMHVF